VIIFWCVDNLIYQRSDCFIDDQLMIGLKFSHSSSRHDSSERRHESGCGTNAAATSPRSGSLQGWGQDCWLTRELERWSLVFHGSLTRHMVRNIVLSINVTSGPAIALIDVMETELFCHRCLEIKTPLLMNIFQENYAILSEICSESSARNFVRMRWD